MVKRYEGKRISPPSIINNLRNMIWYKTDTWSLVNTVWAINTTLQSHHRSWVKALKVPLLPELKFSVQQVRKRQMWTYLLEEMKFMYIPSHVLIKHSFKFYSEYQITVFLSRKKTFFCSSFKTWIKSLILPNAASINTLKVLTSCSFMVVYLQRHSQKSQKDLNLLIHLQEHLQYPFFSLLWQILLVPRRLQLFSEFDIPFGTPFLFHCSNKCNMGNG